MMLPPEIQLRLSNYRHLSMDERARLGADIHSFAKREIGLNGRLRHDAYPDVRSPAPAQSSASADGVITQRNWLLAAFMCARRVLLR